VSERFYFCPDCRTILEEEEVEDNERTCPTCGTTITPDDEIDLSVRSQRMCSVEDIMGKDYLKGDNREI